MNCTNSISWSDILCLHNSVAEDWVFTDVTLCQLVNSPAISKDYNSLFVQHSILPWRLKSSVLHEVYHPLFSKQPCIPKERQADKRKLDYTLCIYVTSMMFPIPVVSGVHPHKYGGMSVHTNIATIKNYINIYTISMDWIYDFRYKEIQLNNQIVKNSTQHIAQRFQQDHGLYFNLDRW